MGREIGITKKFYKVLFDFSADVKKKVFENFKLLIQEGESYSGLDFEKLHAGKGLWYSIRINSDLRAICIIKDADLVSGKKYIFHNMGSKNDRAQESARDLQVQEAYKLGLMDIFSGIIENLEEKLRGPETIRIIGPTKAAEMVKHFEEPAVTDIIIIKKYAYELLKLSGKNATKAEVDMIAEATDENSLVDAFDAVDANGLFDMYVNKDKVYIFKDLSELTKMSEGKLSEWMLFLHGEQVDIVTSEYNGPVRIRGVVGSGKTTVALHRAKHLVENKFTNKDEKVLFVVYNDSLKKAIGELLDILIPEKENRDRIEVGTLNHWAENFISGYGVNRSYSEKTKPRVDECMKIALEGCDETLRKKVNIQDEIVYFIKGYGVKEKTEYLNMKRKGAGGRLTEADREAVYKVYEKYETCLKDKSVSDFHDCIIDAVKLIESGSKPEKYSGIIVDEIQDFKWIDMKLIKLIGDSLKFGKAFIMLVGDFQQKIYKGHYTFDSVGFQIGGARSKVLYKNYRNTKQIFTLAREMVKNVLEGKSELDDVKQFKSELERKPDIPKADGEIPQLRSFIGKKEEAVWIASKIDGMIKAGLYLPGEIAIFYRSRKYLSEVISELAKTGISYIDNMRDDDTKIFGGDKVKIMSLHSAKGLEFKVVFIVGVRDGMVPLFIPVNEEGEQGIIREQLLLYVGMTRAIKELYMTYCKDEGNKMTQKCSRFLKDIDGKFLTSYT